MKINHKTIYIIPLILILIALIPTTNAEITKIEELRSGRIITETIKNNLGNEIQQKNYYVEVLNASSRETQYKKIDFRKTEEELANRLLEREKKRVEELETLKNLNVSQSVRNRGHDNLLLNNPKLYNSLKEDERLHPRRFLNQWFLELGKTKGTRFVEEISYEVFRS